MDITRLLDRRIGLAATQIAIVDESMTITYQELGHRVAALAARLDELSPTPAIVGIAAPRGIDGVIAMLAIWWAGHTYLALDPAQPASRLQEIVTAARADVVLVPEGGHADWAHAAEVQPIAVPGHTEKIVTRTCAEIAYIVFTSGSTGIPKGIEMPERALRQLVEWHGTDGDQVGVRTALCAAVGFDVAIQEVLATLIWGGTLVVVDDATRREPAQLLRFTRERQIHRLFLPTALLQPLANEACRSGSHGPLHDVICAGDQLRITPSVREWFAQLPGTRLHNHYGPAETHVVTSHVLVGDPLSWPDVAPIGRALPHVRLDIGDAGDTADVTEAAELVVRGERVARGYIGRLDLTNERFVDEGAERGYRTGDLVTRSGGVLTFCGRADRQVKISGYRVELDEIEARLAQHPRLAESAVDFVPFEDGPDLVAYVAARAGEGNVLAREIRQYLSATLPAYMIPGRIHQLDEIPLTVNGKLDRKRAAATVSAAADRSPAPQRTDVTGLVRSAFETVLGHREFTHRENFFDIGGTSLRATRVRALLTEELKRDLPIVLIYENPSVAALSKALSLAQARTPRTGSSRQRASADVQSYRRELRRSRRNP